MKEERKNPVLQRIEVLDVRGIYLTNILLHARCVKAGSNVPNGDTPLFPSLRCIIVGAFDIMPVQQRLRSKLDRLYDCGVW
jgi:hypothetical protein